jgi:hypothetical protein
MHGNRGEPALESGIASCWAGLLTTQHPRWHSNRQGSGRDIVDEAGPGTDNRPVANRYSRNRARTDPEESQTSNPHPTSERASWRHMRSFAEVDVVVDDGPGVDNGKILDPTFGIHDGSGHDRNPQPHLCGSGNNGRRTDRVHDLKTIALQDAAHGQTALIVAERHKCSCDPATAEPGQVSIRAHDGDTQYTIRFVVIDEAHNLVFRLRCDEFDDHLGVAAGADNEYSFRIGHDGEL